MEGCEKFKCDAVQVRAQPQAGWQAGSVAGVGPVAGRRQALAGSLEVRQAAAGKAG